MQSQILELGKVEMPDFKLAHNYMTPLNEYAGSYKPLVDQMRAMIPNPGGWVTVHAEPVMKGHRHRRRGAHVDRNYIVGRWGGWCNTAGAGGGCLLVADQVGCVGWRGEVDGEYGEGGDCEHLRDQFPDLEEIVMQPGVVYWANSTGIHESIPMPERVNRALVRITLPHDYILG